MHQPRHDWGEPDGRLRVIEFRKRLVKQLTFRDTDDVDTFALSDDGRQLAIGRDYIAIVDL